jgi:hypothetical protein
VHRDGLPAARDAWVSPSSRRPPAAAPRAPAPPGRSSRSGCASRTGRSGGWAPAGRAPPLAPLEARQQGLGEVEAAEVVEAPHPREVGEEPRLRRFLEVASSTAGQCSGSRRWRKASRSRSLRARSSHGSAAEPPLADPGQQRPGDGRGVRVGDLLRAQLEGAQLLHPAGADGPGVVVPGDLLRSQWPPNCVRRSSSESGAARKMRASAPCRRGGRRRGPRSASGSLLGRAAGRPERRR